MPRTNTPLTVCYANIKSQGTWRKPSWRPARWRSPERAQAEGRRAGAGAPQVRGEGAGRSAEGAGGTASLVHARHSVLAFHRAQGGFQADCKLKYEDVKQFPATRNEALEVNYGGLLFGFWKGLFVTRIKRQTVLGRETVTRSRPHGRRERGRYSDADPGAATRIPLQTCCRVQTGKRLDPVHTRGPFHSHTP